MRQCGGIGRRHGRGKMFCTRLVRRGALGTRAARTPERGFGSNIVSCVAAPMDSPYQTLGDDMDLNSNESNKEQSQAATGGASTMPAVAASGSIGEEPFAAEPTIGTVLENGHVPPSSGAVHVCSDPVGRFLSYAKSGDFFELVAWVVTMAILAGLPHLATSSSSGRGVFRREIPYQETAAGDVLLELMFDNELVDETVNNQLLVVLGVLVPFSLQIILCLTYGEIWYDAHRSILAFSWALGLSTFVVEFTKHYVGYLRPNFYAKCGFDYETMQCDPDTDTNTFTGRKSFMSGHSSMSFAGLTVLSVYMQRLFGVGSGTKRAVVVGDTGANSNAVILRYISSSSPSLQRKQRVLSFLCLLPMFLAVFIAASRVRDNYHHPADIVGGSIVGASAAVWSMGVWFESSKIQILSAA